MGETAQITELVDQLHQLHTEMSTKQTQVEARLEKEIPGIYERLGLDADGESKHNLEQMAEKVAEIDVEVQKIRRTRAAAAKNIELEVPDFNNPLDEASFKARSTRAYKRALERGLRKNMQAINPGSDEWKTLNFLEIEDQEALGITDEQKNSLATDFDPGAGFLAPPTMESAIDRIVLESSPLARFARTVTIGTGSYEGLIRNNNRDTIEQIGEREGRTKRTQLNRYDKLRIDVYESEAAPALTQTQLEDSIIDLGAELQADAAEDFAVDEGRKFINGTGSEEPEGLMVSDKLLVMDSGIADTFDMNGIRRLPQELKVPYKVGASYGVSREALTEIILFRENTGAGPNTGAYMWQPSNQDGTPSRLNGYSWWEAVDMDAPGANTFPIVFGDFNQAYRIVRRRGLRILRDDLTDKPHVVFFMTKRYGGRVWKGEAAVKLRCAV